MSFSNEVDRRLALAMKGDPRYQRREGVWFAWYSVWGWDHKKQAMGWLWLRKVTWLNCLGLGYEYFSKEDT